jgi:hypothetical protein
MKFEKSDLKWIIIRTIGLFFLCLSIYQAYNLIESFFSIVGYNEYIQSYYLFSSKHWKFWPLFRELIFLSVMSYYFLKKGAAAFNLLSTKEDFNE